MTKLSRCCSAPIINGHTEYKEWTKCSKCGNDCDTIEPKEEKEEVLDFVPINTARIIGLTKEDYMQNEEKKEEEDELMEKTIEEQNLAYEAGYKAGIENHLEREVIKEMIAPESNDWISDKMKEFDNKFVSADPTFPFERYWNQDDDEKEYLKEQKQFLKSSLTQQKEAIEEEWRERIGKVKTKIQEMVDRKIEESGNDSFWDMANGQDVKELKELLNLLKV